jgi:uncharacterized coiled-coil protein SlyX
VPEPSTEERLAQLEQIVATQSDMILKLVEMMNHLGSESAATNERLDAVKIATVQQFQDLSAMLQKIVAGFDRGPPPGVN